MCVDFSIRSIHTASSLEAVGYAANSPPCPSDPYSAGGRVFPSLLPPPGQILSREGKKNQDKHMQELGFRHPMKINLSEVISLTRGFLNAFQSFLEEEKYAVLTPANRGATQSKRKKKGISHKKPIARKFQGTDSRGFNKNVICIINHSSMSISLNECQKYYLQQHDLTGLEYII